MKEEPWALVIKCTHALLERCQFPELMQGLEQQNVWEMLESEEHYPDACTHFARSLLYQHRFSASYPFECLQDEAEPDGCLPATL